MVRPVVRLVSYSDLFLYCSTSFDNKATHVIMSSLFWYLHTHSICLATSLLFPLPSPPSLPPSLHTHTHTHTHTHSILLSTSAAASFSTKISFKIMHAHPNSCSSCFQYQLQRPMKIIIIDRIAIPVHWCKYSLFLSGWSISQGYRQPTTGVYTRSRWKPLDQIECPGCNFSRSFWAERKQACQ